MKIYSFRAECFHDVQQFLNATSTTGTTTATIVKPDEVFPDHDIEIQSTQSLEELREIMCDLFDGHIMVQTLRECPLSENSLERDKTDKEKM